MKKKIIYLIIIVLISLNVNALNEATLKFIKVNGIEYREVNCSENMDIARELQIVQTPTIIDPDGTRFVGETAASDWMKHHNV